MSDKASNKENALGNGRKSRLPVPRWGTGKPDIKGLKRPNSKAGDEPEAKKSPTKPLRQPLVAPKLQKKLVAVRPTTKGSSSSAKPQSTVFGRPPLAGRVRQSQRLQQQLGAPLTLKPGTVKAEPINKLTQQNKSVVSNSEATNPFDKLNPFDQNGIEFEMDASSLQSILDNTGIERSTQAAAKPTLPRHTLAGTSTQKLGMFGKPLTHQKPDFKRWCDEFLARSSMSQPTAKKLCTNTDKESGFKFDASRPSDINFCGKFNVPKNPVFTSSANLESGIEGRRSTLSRYVTPIRDGRLSLANRTPLRVKVKEGNGPDRGLEGAVGSAVRTSMCPPVRLPKEKRKSETANRDSVYDAINPQRLSLYSRPSLGPQTPGRVLKPETSATNMDRDPRLSLCPARVLKTVTESASGEALTEPRYSMPAQTPSRVMRNTEENERRETISFNPKLNLGLKLAERTVNQGTENSLGLGTPGRVLRKSPRGKKEGTGEDLSCKTGPTVETEDTAHTPRNKKDEMASASPMFTPGRVPLGNPSAKDIALKTPLRELRQETKDEMGTPSRVLRPSHPDLPTPLRILRSHDTANNHTPQRVTTETPTTPKQFSSNTGNLEPEASETPKTPKQVTHRTPLTPKERILSAIRNSPLFNPPRGNRRFVVQNVLGMSVSPKLVEAMSPLGLQTQAGIPPHDGDTDSSSPLLKRATTPDLSERFAELKSSSPGRMSSPGHMMDLRSIWKTKKSTSKTSVKKEILSSVMGGGVLKESRTSPRHGRLAVTSDKKKKTLTWADRLEGFKSVDGKKADLQKGRKSLFVSNEEGEAIFADTASKELFPHYLEENVSKTRKDVKSELVEKPDSQRSSYSCSDDVTDGSSLQCRDQQPFADDSHRTTVVQHEALDDRVKDDATRSSHNAMQEAPSQETRTPPPPPPASPQPPLTTQSSPQAMQLPLVVCPPVLSGEGVTVDNRGWNQSRAVPQGPGEYQDVTHLNMAAQYLTASSGMTQLDLHAHQSEASTSGLGPESKNRNLEQFQEYLMKMKIGNLQKNSSQGHDLGNMNQGQESKSVDMTMNISNNNLESVLRDYFDKTGMVWNPQCDVRSDDDVSMKIDNHSQGTYQTHPRVLDVNSNITLSATTVPAQLAPQTAGSQRGQGHTFTVSSSSYTTTRACEPIMSNPSRKRQQDCDENLTPFILRNTTETVIDTSDNTMREVEDTEETLDKLDTDVDTEQALQTGTLYFPTPVAAVRPDVVDQSGTGTKGLELPIWTPLALKTVARQQQDKHVTNLATFSHAHEESLEIDIKPDISSPERQVLSDVTDIENTQPDVNITDKHAVSDDKAAIEKQRTAFRPLGRHTKLNPSLGPLSLRGNLNTSLKHKRPCKRSGHLTSLMQMDNERYHDALVDDEVELYMCRLGKKRILGYREECCNPVAKILTEGDDMTFVPVKEDLKPGEKVVNLESAFEKCMRST